MEHDRRSPGSCTVQGLGLLRYYRPMLPVSVPILTLNSKKYLKRNLPRLKRHFDDVFIVDGNSTDGTREYAESLGVRVENQFEHHIPNTRITDFKVMRLKSWSLAKHPWILYFDADEIPGRGFFEAVEAAIKEPAVYSFQRRLVTQEGTVIRNDPWYKPSIRLFRPSDITFKEKRVHEHLVVKAPIRSTTLPAEILCPDTPKRMEERSRGYLDLEGDLAGYPWTHRFRWIFWYNLRSLLGQSWRYLMHRLSPDPMPWDYARVFLKYRIKAMLRFFR